MTRLAYDNWERLVKATLDREELRHLALLPSRNTSFSSSISTPLPPLSVIEFEGHHIFAHAMMLAYRVIRVSEESVIFKQECSMMKPKAQKLAGLLRRAACGDDHPYDRPTRRVVDSTERALEKALALLLKCSGRGLMTRVLTSIPRSAFSKISSEMQDSIDNVSWLLRIFFPADDEYLGLPPVVDREPILWCIWQHIAALYKGSVEDRANAAAALKVLAEENEWNRELIIKEGGVEPLLKLVLEGKLKEQENAAIAIGCLGNDWPSAKHIVEAGACSVFKKILNEGPMKLQAAAAWAVSELAAHYPYSQSLFAEPNIIRLLVTQLGSEIVREHSKYSVIRKATSMQAAVVLANTADSNNRNAAANDSSTDDAKSLSVSGMSIRVMEMEDAEMKAYRCAMVARALWQLAKGNTPICRSISETKALWCFALLLEKGPAEVQFNSAMAIMEITAVAEQDSELRRSVFKPSSPTCKALIDQLIIVIEKGNSKILVPCIKAVGNLARVFRVTERRMISPLVKLLDEGKAEVSREACIALTKFASSDNYLHLDHSRAIIAAGGAKLLVQLVNLGEQIVQSPALILLCYIALHVPDSEELSRNDVLGFMGWSSRQAHLFPFDDDDENLLNNAIRILELR